MKHTETDRINRRAVVVGVMLSLWFAFIGGRAVYLQAFQDDWLSERASNQYEKTCRQLGKRGTIFDAHLREMAVSVDAVSIAARPGKIDNVSQTAGALAEILNLSGKSVKKQLSANRSFVWVERQVTPRETEAVMALSLPGISFQTEHQRFYPNRTLAAQVIGFAGIDGHGLEGVEFRFDQELKGDARRYTMLKDALGRGFSPNEADAALPAGNNLILTIDQTVQYFVEQALEEAVTAAQGRSGMAIVMTPQTGAILALAHYPFFNPNAYREFDREVWRNRAITDPYEPGSTLKIFTAAAAIERGGLTANDIFFCENGAFRIGRNTIHDTHPHGWLSLQRIIQYSSNIGAVKVCSRIGPEALHTTLKAFGFGRKTGINCPGESAGTLLPFDRWSGMDAGAIAFGQGVSVSALQLVTAVSAIANDGVLMTPYIVQAVTDPHGRIVKRFSPKKVRQAISRDTARAVTRMLETVTQADGTGAEAAMETCRVAGKTGTAQKVDDRGQYAQGKYIASFVGFFPARNPRATILVVVDEPEKMHYGGQVAGPAFKRIARELIHYLNTEPSGSKGKLTAALAGEVCG